MLATALWRVGFTVRVVVSGLVAKKVIASAVIALIRCNLLLSVIMADVTSS